MVISTVDGLHDYLSKFNTRLDDLNFAYILHFKEFDFRIIVYHGTMRYDMPLMFTIEFRVPNSSDFHKPFGSYCPYGQYLSTFDTLYFESFVSKLTAVRKPVQKVIYEQLTLF